MLAHLLGMTKPVGAFQVSSLIWIEPLFEPTTFIGLGVPLTMASQNPPGFAFDNLQGEHTGHIGAAASAFRQDTRHMWCRDPVLALERLGRLEIVWAVHVLILAGWVERMVRVGEGDHQEERLVLGGLGGDKGGGVLADIMARIKFFGHPGSNRLRAGVVMR